VYDVARFWSIRIKGALQRVTPSKRFSRNHRPILLALTLLTFFALILSAWSNSEVDASQPRKVTVVFAVTGRPDETSMDPVVIVERGHFLAPYSDAEQNTFGEKFFAAGKTYRLIFGGGDAGSVTVDKWSVGCNNIHAQVTVSSSTKLGGRVMALATSSETLGKRASSRRAPTDSERQAVLTLMKTIYRQKLTPSSSIPSIKISNLTATDLDGDGKYEFIGSFALAAKNKFERDLFLIAKPQGAAMRADFVKFQAYQPPPEGFFSSIDFVDQLDLDGDGVSEVFAEQGGFDGYGYLIFKKAGGRWRQVFDMAGDAC